MHRHRDLQPERPEGAVPVPPQNAAPVPLDPADTDAGPVNDSQLVAEIGQLRRLVHLPHGWRTDHGGNSLRQTDDLSQHQLFGLLAAPDGEYSLKGLVAGTNWTFPFRSEHWFLGNG